MSSSRTFVAKETGVSLDELRQLAQKRKLKRREKKAGRKRGCFREAASRDDQGSPEVQLSDEVVEIGSAKKSSKLNDGFADERGKEEFPVLTRTRNLYPAPALQHYLPDWINMYTAVSSDIACESQPLDDFMLPDQVRENLEAMGVDKFFPIQIAVIPEVLKSSRGLMLACISGLPPPDLCVCAPTGCGKTLCYVVPIVCALMSRHRCRLAALVVVPSQELAIQVAGVFEQLCKGTGVTIGTTCALKPFEEEQDLLLDSRCEPIASGIDVLVATPGRLVDHLKATPHLDLGRLRYLVLDEADGLLDQQFHGWLSAVLHARQPACRALSASWYTSSLPLVLPNLVLPTPPSPFPRQSSDYSFRSSLCSSALTIPSQPLQKMLFSATLRLDPEQLALLNLHQPKLFSVAAVEGGEILGQSSLPSTLTEYAVPCSAQLRPLALLYLLVSRGHSNSLCFTNSRETTHRLALLLKQFRKEVSVEELSSDTGPSQRSQVLKDFVLGNIQVLVCSDMLARGMDIPAVKCIINYEPPQHFRSYQHRVGRTARAGCQGTAYTLLAEEEEAKFAQVLKEVGRKGLETLRVDEQEMKPFMNHYPVALQTLKQRMSYTGTKQTRH